jgi:2-dehydropantoate 2-reductase
MHFLVVGPGAMGSLFAARLKKAGFDVTLLDYIKDRANRINDHGIKVEGVTGDYRVKVPTTTGDISQPPDLVLICVKAYDTREASLNIEPWLKPETGVVTLQNGVGNLEILEEIFGSDRVLGGVTAEGATLLGPGKIRHAGRGETIIGPSGDSGSLAERMVAAFNRAGFQTRSVTDVKDLIWGKLLINVGINALTAITRLKNGRLPELEGTRLIMEEAVKEAVAVAEAKNVNLPYPDPIGRVIEVCRATAGNIASMLQDVLKEKLTEIDFINGAIVREGRALGIPTPVNLTLTSLVQVIQKTYPERVV